MPFKNITQLQCKLWMYFKGGA